MIGELTSVQGADERRRSEHLSTRPSRPPTQVPGYEPERFLGRGAFGEVWVATDLNTRRRVAIKFYNQRGGADWSLLSREVEKLAFLFNDRHVVQLIQVGWEADPPYYIMEYLEHGSLEERLQGGPLEVLAAAALFREVAQGLEHAHAKGIMHCDLKPGNILLDQDGKPRLADFGQARLSHEHAPALGTLFYMAPEQADLKAAPDARWDVYALGAILYRMLTGQAPYQDLSGSSEITQPAKLEERLERYRRLLRAAPRPGAHRRMPGVDAALADIVDRCLAAKADKRFPNVQAVLSALDARALRRARRPLLVLGAVGPALLLLVMVVLAGQSFATAVRESSDQLTRRAQQSNQLGAVFATEAIALQIDQRWRILESEAADDDLRALLRDAGGRPKGSPAQKAVQVRLEALYRKHSKITRARFWFADDAQGTQLGLASATPASRDDPTVGENFAWRTYFHGGRHDLKLGENQPASQVIDRPHVSKVYVSKATKSQMVAFSVPVWDRDPDQADRKVLGVLILSNTLGDLFSFGSSPRPDAGATAPQELAVKWWSLVDLNEDRPAKGDRPAQKGLLLQHSARQPAASQDSIEELRWPAELVTRADGLRACRSKGSSSCDELAILNSYQDPTEPQDEPGNAWLAVIEPVLVPGRPDPERDTGWVVVVQERTADVLAPAQALKRTLLGQGLIGLTLILGVVSALWAFVVVSHSDASRSRLAAFLRRKAGLTSVPVPGRGTGTASARSEGRSGGGRLRATTGRPDATPAPAGRAPTNPV